MSENLALPPLAAQAPLAAELEELPLPYLEIDAQGRVLRANCALQAIHHPGYGSLIGKSAWELLATDEEKVKPGGIPEAHGGG
jgi:hypothetical protein